MADRKLSFPCLICGKKLSRVDTYEAQPNDAVMCETTGNYGSTVFDSFNGDTIRFNICDPCFVRAGDEGKLFISQERLPVVTRLLIEDDYEDTGIGSRRVERPFVKWDADLEPSEEREHLTADEVRTRLDDRDYHWIIDRPTLTELLARVSPQRAT